MKPCPVCGAENDDFTVVCTSCKGFIQTKVDTLDLFRTIWGLLEAPSATFRRIALSRIKNYVIPLAILLGITMAYMLFWNANLGVRVPQLITLIGLGLLSGPILGVLFVCGIALLVKALAPRMGGRITFRNAFAVLSYAAVPVVLSLFLVFPFEIAVFGIYLFDKNPPPIVLNPVAFILLVGLNGVAVVWSLALSGIGMRVVAGVSRFWTSVLVVFFMVAVGGLFLIPLR